MLAYQVPGDGWLEDEMAGGVALMWTGKMVSTVPTSELESIGTTWK